MNKLNLHIELLSCRLVGLFGFLVCIVRQKWFDPLKNIRLKSGMNIIKLFRRQYSNLCLQHLTIHGGLA